MGKSILQLKSFSMTNILTILDEKIEGFKQSKGDYPSKIILSKETKEKIFIELKNIDITLSWVDSEDNYKGILIEIKENVFIELE